VQRQFELAFQPQIDLLTMQVVGAEALLRCTNPFLHSLSARELVTLAEETGLASSLSEWVLEAACKQLSDWRKRQIPELKVAVNVSSVQLMDPGFVGQVHDTIERHQLPAALLELDLTEGGLVAASSAGSDVMESLKTIGVSLSIDDFGTGISTLSYLKHYPVDMLKVDASLVRNLPRDREDAAIVSAIIKLAGDLRIKVIAEGVETFEQLNFLRSTSCHHVQGFLFSEALRPDKFEQLLQHRKQQGQFFH
jgi:EAL domain-containing protein (putative c-di-GMP-specific phosphodiesterase class I)